MVDTKKLIEVIDRDFFRLDVAFGVAAQDAYRTGRQVAEMMKQSKRRSFLRGYSLRQMKRGRG